MTEESITLGCKTEIRCRHLQTVASRTTVLHFNINAHGDEPFGSRYKEAHPETDPQEMWHGTIYVRVENLGALIDYLRRVERAAQAQIDRYKDNKIEHLDERVSKLQKEIFDEGQKD